MYYERHKDGGRGISDSGPWDTQSAMIGQLIDAGPGPDLHRTISIWRYFPGSEIAKVGREGGILAEIAIVASYSDSEAVLFVVPSLRMNPFCAGIQNCRNSEVLQAHRSWLWPKGSKLTKFEGD